MNGRFPEHPGKPPEFTHRQIGVFGVHLAESRMSAACSACRLACPASDVLTFSRRSSRPFRETACEGGLEWGSSVSLSRSSVSCSPPAASGSCRAPGGAWASCSSGSSSACSAFSASSTRPTRRTLSGRSKRSGRHDMERMRIMRKVLLAFSFIWCLALAGVAQAQAPEAAAPPPAAAPAAAAPAAAPVPITDADVKAVAAPKPEDRAGGDPSGAITGTVADIPVADAKVGLTVGDLVSLIGQHQIAINFVWTLVAGFLVMFMQAGFAIVETGLGRAKNANHTMMMNFMVYGIGMLAYWLIGFSIQEGGVGAVANLGGTAPLNGEFAIHLFGKDWGLFGTKGMLLGGATYDVGVMVMFLF